MFPFYRNYIWVDGYPYGADKVKADSDRTFRIVQDPYRKWVSIEAYEKGLFQSVVYDSKLFDFRDLEPAKQAVWQRDSSGCIRDENDRVILKEKTLFKGSLCHLCRTFSAHGIFLSEQNMTYALLGEEENTVILRDSLGRPVMGKRYNADSSGCFTELVEESWKSSDIQLWPTFSALPPVRQK